MTSILGCWRCWRRTTAPKSRPTRSSRGSWSTRSSGATTRGFCRSAASWRTILGRRKLTSACTSARTSSQATCEPSWRNCCRRDSPNSADPTTCTSWSMRTSSLSTILLSRRFTKRRHRKMGGFILTCQSNHDRTLIYLLKLSYIQNGSYIINSLFAQQLLRMSLSTSIRSLSVSLIWWIISRLSFSTLSFFISLKMLLRCDSFFTISLFFRIGFSYTARESAKLD